MTHVIFQVVGGLIGFAGAFFAVAGFTHESPDAVITAICGLQLVTIGAVLLCSGEVIRSVRRD